MRVRHWVVHGWPPLQAMNTIETVRLLMRPFTRDDLDEFALICSDREVMRYIGNGKPQSREQTSTRLDAIIEHRNKHFFGLWAAIERATGSLVGFCGLQFLDNTSEVEVGYRLARRYWGRGLATEGAQANLRYGFEELRLDRIVAVVHPHNIASSRVLEKIGLRFVRDAHFYNKDVKYYAVTRQEYELDESRQTKRAEV